MARVVDINDPSDARLDDFRALADADVRPDRRGVVIAEGVSVVERLVDSPYPVRAVAGVASKLDALAPLLTALDAPVYRVDKWVLSEAVGFRVTRGVLASADRVTPSPLHQLLESARRLAVVEALNDFENLGALFRNAAALGVDAVLLDPRTADPLYRRSVRVSMGHVLRVPFAVLDGAWPRSLDAVRRAGFDILAMTPRREAVTLPELAASADRPAKWAVLLGAEGPGLTDEAIEAADRMVRIEMADGVDSLNVATAAAIAFERLRG